MAKNAGEKRAAKRNGKALNVWIDTKLRDLFADSAEKNRRQLNAETEIAIEEYLAKRGLLPVGTVHEQPI